MSHYDRETYRHSRETQRSTVIDYERQFQEDLERAQALSLESLALEKFRLQKQQANCNHKDSVQYDSQAGSGRSESPETIQDKYLTLIFIS